MTKQGFSLIETLIGFAIVAVVLTATNVLLFSSLRTAKKAEAVGQSKAEGSIALQGMEQLMRYAHAIAPGTCNGNTVTIYRYVKDSNGVTKDHDITYSLSGTQIASSSSFLPASAPSIPLTSAQVSVSACPGGIFTCPAVPVGQKVRVIKICYLVKTTTSTDPAADSGSARFETQVTLRNIDN